MKPRVPAMKPFCSVVEIRQVAWELGCLAAAFAALTLTRKWGKALKDWRNVSGGGRRLLHQGCIISTLALNHCLLFLCWLSIHSFKQCAWFVKTADPYKRQHRSQHWYVRVLSNRGPQNCLLYHRQHSIVCRRSDLCYSQNHLRIEHASGSAGKKAANCRYHWGICLPEGQQMG